MKPSTDLRAVPVPVDPDGRGPITSAWRRDPGLRPKGASGLLPAHPKRGRPMRATLGLVAVLLLLLPACERLEGVVPGQAPPSAGVPKVSVTSLDAAPAAEGASGAAEGVVGPEDAAVNPAAAALPETTPSEATAADAPEAEAPPPDVLRSPARIACERDGGSFARVGTTGSFACVRRTRDSGKTCDREGDCEGLCLARSRTCAPVKPLFGCQEILQQDGLRVTQCLE